MPYSEIRAKLTRSEKKSILNQLRQYLKNLKFFCGDPHSTHFSDEKIIESTEFWNVVGLYDFVAVFGSKFIAQFKSLAFFFLLAVSFARFLW